MAGLPTNISEAVKRRNPKLFPSALKAENPHPASKDILGAAGFGNPESHEDPLGVCAVQPSTDETKLNKTERQYWCFIRCLGFVWVGVQNITLKLGHTCRFTPDFMTIDKNGHIQAREVKGFMRDDALVKLKVAARMFPFIEFIVVRKTKGGWDHTTVKP